MRQRKGNQYLGCVFMRFCAGFFLNAFLCDFACCCFFWQKRKIRKNGRKIEKKNVSKWCANLIKSRFTSKKKKMNFFFLQISIFLQSSFTSIKNKKLLFFDFFWLFSKKIDFYHYQTGPGAIMLKLKNKDKTVPESRKRVKVVRQPHKSSFTSIKNKKSFFLFSTFFWRRKKLDIIAQ